jgi:hypothetical protein
VSSIALGYPLPVISGYELKGDLDAAVSHLAKVRNIMRYLDDLPPAADDDLMLVIDGYDVVMHLPVEVMLQRYFDVVNAANARLEERFGKGSTRPVPEGDQPRQTILFGADKICWPVDWRRLACWAVPTNTTLPRHAFGVEDGSMPKNQPRWLNSGTIMGPVGDMRQMVAATLERIRTTYDPAFEFRESDQMYMSDVWGDQEYYRSVREMRRKGQAPVEGEPIPKGGPWDKFLPKPAARQKTEYHIAMEYESVLFQTRAGNEDFLDFPVFNRSGYTSRVTRPVVRGRAFRPYEIQLPQDVIASLTRILQSISSVHVLPVPPAELVGRLHIGTNLVTKVVYALYHCTGGKGYLDELWLKLWYYPYVKSLLKTAVRDTVQGRPLADNLIDGRVWTMAHKYPASTPKGEDVSYKAAGAWADVSDGWLDWNTLCGPWESEMFGGPKPEQPKEPEKLEEPEKPKEPENAQEPEPEKPKEPEPEKPTEPKPEGPNEPEKPQEAEKPKEPETPKEAHGPENPTEAEKPNEPAKPIEADKPKEPDGPKEPSEPQDPQPPKEQDPSNKPDSVRLDDVSERHGHIHMPASENNP